MGVLYYPAVITQAKGDTGYTIQVLDIPEAISQGETIAEAMEGGREALALAVEDYKGELPEPTAVHLIEGKLDRDQKREKVLVQYIAVAEPEQSVRINITLPGDLVKRIDLATDNRSGFLAEAAREKLNNGVFREGKRAAFPAGKKSGINMGTRKKA